MNKNMKRTINLILIMIVAIVAFLAIKSIPDFLMKNVAIEKTEGEEILGLAPGSVFVADESTVIGFDPIHFEVSGISQIYCAQKGGHVSLQGDYYEDLEADIEAHKNDKATCMTHVYVESRAPLKSKIYYSIESTREATPEEAYIVTYPIPGVNDWSEEKQYAVWGSTMSNNSATPPSSGGSDSIIAEAQKYGEFNPSQMSQMANPTGSGDNVKVSVAQNPKEYIIGPFPGLQYGNGQYDNIAFGGISNAYINAESGKIEIKSFIIGGTEITPKYFTPDGVELVDRNPQAYPKSGEEYYVKYVSDKEEQINEVHFDFQWMEATATLTYYKGTRYQTSYTFDHPEHTHTVKTHCSHPDTCTSSHTKTIDCWDCEVASAKIVAMSDPSQMLMSAEGERHLNQSSLDIPIPAHSEPTSPGNNTLYNPPDQPTTPPEKNLQIKLAGHVWEDEDASKRSEPNGVKEESENVKPGVEVILHEQGGAEVARTVTDSTGYYEFNNLNAQKKYYVEFVYDGQIYQATRYDTTLSNEQRLEGWKNNGTEDPNERVNFNNHFAQISSAPGNYTVRRSLYYSNGSKNRAWIIEKESSETPYGIKEIYDYLIEQAVETKSYQTAYANALSKFGNNDTTKSKLQFIEDCRISAYTGYNAARVNYPIWDNFNESTESRTVAGVFYPALYPTHLQIDFGLNRREQFDMALRKDVQKATIEINGKVHTYTYDTRSFADETDHGTWDINVRLSDSYYNTKYSREIFGSDYQYKASNYDNSAAYGKTKADELNVYVTYKLTVRNQSQSIQGEITEIVDYFDEDYEYVDDRSYIEIRNGNNKGQYPVNASSTSMYGNSNSTDIAGYDAVYVKGLQGKKLTTGQTAYIYLTFKVKKDTINGEDWIRLDETVERAQAIGVGKENIAEINGFKTYYRDGTYIPNVGKTSNSKVAGLFDRDSVPGNINPNDVPKDGNINYDNFEDDTDKAPNIRLIIYRENGEIVCRTMDGIIWEDERNVINDEQVTAVGDGKYEASKETAINGLTVELVELMNNGTEYVWERFSSGQGTYKPIINLIGESGTALIPDVVDNTVGKYVFKSYPTGNYIVRFIYGDTVKTALPNVSTDSTRISEWQGQNAKSYNGQDYKTTTYQTGIAQSNINDVYNNNTSGSFVYNITASDAANNVSDAKDIMTDNNLNNQYYRQNATLNSREDVIGYSDKEVINRIAAILASHEKAAVFVDENGNKVYYSREELQNMLTELMAKTQMTAETGVIDIEVEYDRIGTENQGNYGGEQQNNTTYKIQNLSLGLEERPKAQLSVNKEVRNVKLTLADGSTLFDATQKASNVLWRNHKPHKFDYSNNKLEKDPMVEIRDFDAQYGLIQMSMDEELMHGATIKISYKVTVSNKGEVDYKDNMFYYTGIVSNPSTVVKTHANQVIDYVANNLQFYAVDNSSWSVIDEQTLMANGNETQTLVNSKLTDEVKKYNTIITTNENSNIAKTALLPEKYDETKFSVSDDLVLTQLITSENETDDLTYRNIVEIVKTSNDVGRRMAYSVVGNQNPNKNADIAEVDSDVAQIVKILPPFGNAGMPYIIAGITLLASAILVTGIIFIKKKVLK